MEDNIVMTDYISEDIYNWKRDLITEFDIIIDISGTIHYMSENAVHYFSPYKGKDSSKNIQALMTDEVFITIKKAIEISDYSEKPLIIEKFKGKSYTVSWMRNYTHVNNYLYYLIFKEIPSEIQDKKTDIPENKQFESIKKEEDLSELIDLKQLVKITNQSLELLELTSYKTIEELLQNSECILQTENLSLYQYELLQESIVIIRYSLNEEKFDHLIKIPERISFHNSTDYIAETKDLIRTIADDTIDRTAETMRNIENSVGHIVSNLKSDSGNYEDMIKNTAESLSKMSEFSQFIDDVSVKIHLISINAAIESARKGEAGKGFAIIAREIRKLSEETKSYINMINNEISEITTRFSGFTENDFTEERQNMLKKLIHDFQEEIQTGIDSTRKDILNDVEAYFE